MPVGWEGTENGADQDWVPGLAAAKDPAAWAWHQARRTQGNPLFLDEEPPIDEFRFQKLQFGSLGRALTSSEKAKESKESEEANGSSSEKAKLPLKRAHEEPGDGDVPAEELPMDRDKYLVQTSPTVQAERAAAMAQVADPRADPGRSSGQETLLRSLDSAGIRGFPLSTFHPDGPSKRTHEEGEEANTAETKEEEEPMKKGLFEVAKLPPGFSFSSGKAKQALSGGLFDVAKMPRSLKRTHEESEEDNTALTKEEEEERMKDRLHRLGLRTIGSGLGSEEKERIKKPIHSLGIRTPEEIACAAFAGAKLPSVPFSYAQAATIINGDYPPQFRHHRSLAHPKEEDTRTLCHPNCIVTSQRGCQGGKHCVLVALREESPKYELLVQQFDDIMACYTSFLWWQRRKGDLYRSGYHGSAIADAQGHVARYKEEVERLKMSMFETAFRTPALGHPCGNCNGWDAIEARHRHSASDATR